MLNVKLKQRNCKVCHTKFMPDRPLQSVCSIKCARIQADRVRDKTEKKDYKLAKERLKTRGDWAKEAQAAFNGWIRRRDEGKPCISCGSLTGKKNAGHYRSVGSCPELRFEPLNVHLQCEKCNSYLSGNLIEYRKELINRIGLDGVEFLEGPHPPKKYSIDDLKALKSVYRKMKGE